MRNHFRIITALAIAFVATATSFADVKIKSKQTMSGQTYENTTYIKGKRSRAESMNGAMINITQCDLRRGVQINQQTRTYMINEFGQAVQNGGQSVSTTDQNGVVRAGGNVTTTITTKDTGERKQMFGYVAKHLIITMETVSSPDACSPTNTKMQMDGWYIDAEFALDCDYGQQTYSGNPSNRKAGCQDKYTMKQVGTVKRGYPVYEKMTMFDQNGSETFSIVNEVVELSKATLEAALFEVPADYRQVTDASQMYAVSASTVSSSMSYPSSSSSSQSVSGLSQSIQNSSNATKSDQPVSAKKPGTLRIGLATVKTGAVGDGITAADLSAAVRNSLAEYLKVPKVEVINLDAKLASAIDAEAKEKECDYVVFATISHKKGGGGFGMFGNALGSAVGRVGIGHTGSTAGNIAGQIATQSIVSATTVSATVKAKDELTLDLRLNKIGTDVLAKQFKAKAKSNGDDIISQIVEQAAQAIVTTVGVN